jgi:hypothetical protein
MALGQDSEHRYLVTSQTARAGTRNFNERPASDGEL